LNDTNNAGFSAGPQRPAQPDQPAPLQSGNWMNQPRRDDPYGQTPGTQQIIASKQPWQGQNPYGGGQATMGGGSPNFYQNQAGMANQGFGGMQAGQGYGMNPLMAILPRLGFGGQGFGGMQGYGQQMQGYRPQQMNPWGQQFGGYGQGQQWGNRMGGYGNPYAQQPNQGMSLSTQQPNMIQTWMQALQNAKQPQAQQPQRSGDLRITR